MKILLCESEDEKKEGSGKSEPPAAFLLPLEGTDTVRKYLIEL
jgi:hypothetical protein